MHVRRLELSGFRNYTEAVLELEPGVTALVGPNGQGKTNALEALGYVATLGSHRVAGETALVLAGRSEAVIRADVFRETRVLRAELELANGRANRARVNGVPLARPREILGLLRTVLFAPEDLHLVRGDPDGRRRFLDELATQRTPRLAGLRADYERTVKQRTALLRSAAATRRPVGELATLEVWDDHLARHGGELLAARLELLDALGPLLAAAYAAVAGPARGPAWARYSSATELPETRDPGVLAEALLVAVAASRAAELERGVTLVGPHRDDLTLGIGELPARGYASHGEGWTLALALRLASYQLLRSDGAEPVLMLDDVFAELDTGRRDALVAVAAAAEQCLVTVAVAEDLPVGLGGRTVGVDAGAFSGVPA